MLKQILKAGYVDPELLEVLTEEQKDIIFEKMREEQIRKWREREAIFEKSQARSLHRRRVEKKTKVEFKIATDGNPWVWVMGEHPDDLSYDKMVQKREKEEEEREKARLRKEAEELAIHETRSRDILLAPEKEETDFHSLARTESAMDSDNVSTGKSLRLWQKAIDNRSELVRRMSTEEQRDYEKRRADELYQNMLRSQEVKKKRVSDVVMEALEKWKESEKAAKEFERKRRQSFLKAKRLSSSSLADQILEGIPDEKKESIKQKMSERVLRGTESSSFTTTETNPPRRVKKLGNGKPEIKLFRQTSFAEDPETRPKTMENAIRWFKENERPKGVGKDIDGCVSLWFHGATVKKEAEEILTSKSPGYFLIRISNKVWGYIASVKTNTKVKHYVIMATERIYRFVGNNQPEFSTLAELLKYYRHNPITWAGQETLLLPCEQNNEQLKVINTIFEDEETAM